MHEEAPLKFYLTPDHPCSYFEGRQARTLFIEPKQKISDAKFALLSEHGFRRSGEHIYRPHCETCAACESLRIPINTFKFSKSQKRILSKNSSVKLSIKPVTFHQDHYNLYERYINQRHRHGDMYPASEEQYQDFLLSEFKYAHLWEFHEGKRLIAVSVIDTLPHALSAVYTFFEPDLAERSLGSFAILKQVEACRQLNYRYLYLGYHIEGSPKMAYKSRYRPHEVFRNNEWVKIVSIEEGR